MEAATLAACTMNRLVLQATLIERGALRYTPAGIPAIDCFLRHESYVTEAGQSRRAALEIKAVVVGEMVAPVQVMPLGNEGNFSGFLTAHRNGKGVVFHITQVSALLAADSFIRPD